MTRQPARRLTRVFMGELPDELLQGKVFSLAEDQHEVIDRPLGANNDAVELDFDLIEALFTKATEKDYDNSVSDDWALDRWLAPRIHYAIRVPRRVAADRRFWAWIAVKFAANYVYTRFEKKGQVTANRFVGDDLRNGVSRLWWAAELVRRPPVFSSTSV